MSVLCPLIRFVDFTFEIVKPYRWSIDSNLLLSYNLEMGKLPSKIQNLMNEIALALEEGRYLDTRHAFERQTQRKLSRPDILHVLRKGFHEKRKDSFDETFQAWNYAIRGRTIDKRELRIIRVL